MKGRKASLHKKFRVSYLSKDTSLTQLASCRSKSLLELQLSKSPEKEAENADKVDRLVIEPKSIGNQESRLRPNEDLQAGGALKSADNQFDLCLPELPNQSHMLTAISTKEKPSILEKQSPNSNLPRSSKYNNYNAMLPKNIDQQLDTTAAETMNYASLSNQYYDASKK